MNIISSLRGLEGQQISKSVNLLIISQNVLYLDLNLRKSEKNLSGDFVQ